MFVLICLERGTERWSILLSHITGVIHIVFKARDKFDLASISTKPVGRISVTSRCRYLGHKIYSLMQVYGSIVMSFFVDIERVGWL